MSALPPKADILRGNINPPLLPAKLFPASTHTGHKLPAVGSYTIAHIARISAASARAPACAARSNLPGCAARWTPSDRGTLSDRGTPSDRWTPLDRWRDCWRFWCFGLYSISSLYSRGTLCRLGAFVLERFRNAETRFSRGPDNREDRPERARIFHRLLKIGGALILIVSDDQSDTLGFRR